jgi:hypothetical protein
VQTIAESGEATNGTWSRGDVILFAETENDGISRVAASGGPVTKATHVDTALREQWHHTPSFLPDGRHFLFLGGPPGAVYVGALDSTERTRLTASDTRAIYGAGRLLFVRERRLFAQPFDPGTLALSGQAVPLADDIINNPTSSIAGVSASSTGTVIYRNGSLNGGAGHLAWFDRTGHEIGTVGEGYSFLEVELSPDGKRFAATVSDPKTRASDVWVFDVARNAGTRITLDGSLHDSPKWSPAGDRVMFHDVGQGRATVAIKSADGTGPERTVLALNSTATPDSWYGDGRAILYEASDPMTSWDLWTSPVDTPNPHPVVQLPGSQDLGAVSADGQWLAYRSTESGRSEIYVTRFPAAAGKWQVSISGGISPRWRRDGRELYFLSPDHKLMAVTVKGTASGFEVGRPLPLFDAAVASQFNWPYDVSADGQRFLINIAATQTEQQINVVLNWTNGLASTK